MRIRLLTHNIHTPDALVAYGHDHGSFWWILRNDEDSCMQLMISPNNPHWVPRGDDPQEEYVWVYPAEDGIACYIEYMTMHSESNKWLRNVLRLSAFMFMTYNSNVGKPRLMYAIHKDWPVAVDKSGPHQNNYVMPENIINVMCQIAAGICSAIDAGEVYRDRDSDS